MPFGQGLSMTKLSHITALITISIAAVAAANAQALSDPLDPTRSIAVTAAQPRTTLPEEYIWTAGDITVNRPDHAKYPWNRTELRTTPHLFRKHFRVETLPKSATLYVAGPREAHVYLNGQRIDEFYTNTDAPIGFRVFRAAVLPALRTGDNVLAIEAVRGRGVVSVGDSKAIQQLAYGEILAAKITPAEFGADVPALVISDSSWRSLSSPESGAPEHWADAAFDDSSWQGVSSLGPVESNVDFFQWSVDAGMYGWPGYMGMSPALRTFALPAVAVTHVFTGKARLANLTSLTSVSADAPFTVSRKEDAQTTDAEAPSLLLDFGREVAGRLLVESASSTDATLSIAYGESEIEALATGLAPGQQGGNYLGTNLLAVPANGVARGPKSGFRYVRISFLRGAPTTAFRSIRVEGIYYPVTYAGSFESSDPLLNRIWETGAYTVHLCMQDGVWDSVKRDRGRWVGDLDVEGRVISTVFGDRAQIEETLRSLVPPAGGYVNGVPGFSALWVTTLANFYQHTGDKAFLNSERESLLGILSTMDASLKANGLFNNAKHRWLFVDWAPRLYGLTPEAEMGTQLQYVSGYRAAAALFREMKDTANATRYDAQAKKTLEAAHTLRDKNDATYGGSWQINSLATLLDGVRNQPILWRDVLSRVKQDSPVDQSISPYFGAHVLDAMAAMNHHREALDWIRTYWGGMLAEGATSFWESYDLRWPKTNYHLSLQADGTSGTFVSLAHGWSSGPTAWLTENVLGVTPDSPGYDAVAIHPHLSGLDFARGTVPTPHGVIAVRADKEKGIEVDLPAGITRTLVTYERPDTSSEVYLDGKLVRCEGCAAKEREVEITQPGHHTIGSR